MKINDLAIKTISKPYGMIEKLWKKSFNSNEEYRPLSFLIFKECADGLLILNTVSSELILISEEDWNNPNPEIKKELVEKHFLVPENMDDKKYIDQLRVLLSMALRNNAITKFTILPTSCCNARCFYCFESEYKQVTMSEETAKKTVNFIVENSYGKNVKLDWFGGEPLLGSDTIDYICSELKAKGIEYTSTMISNGYLFSEEMAEKAKNLWNLNRIQITLDGTEDVYNKTKNYKYKNIDESPFYRVLKNIEYITDNEINVDIRLNMSLYNVEDIKNLVNELEDRFKGNKYIHIYCRMIFEDTGFEPVKFNAETNEKLYTENKEINHRLASLGFSSKNEYLPVLKYISCLADSGSVVVINPLGEIAKCEQHCMDKLVGDIDNGITDKAMLKYWQQKVTWNLCNTCQLYPYCYRLKGCDSAVECKEYMKKDKIYNIQKTMEYKYKQFLKKNTPQEYVEEEKDFDD